jgi:hypothetical protein
MKINHLGTEMNQYGKIKKVNEFPSYQKNSPSKKFIKTPLLEFLQSCLCGMVNSLSKTNSKNHRSPYRILISNHI